MRAFTNSRLDKTLQLVIEKRSNSFMMKIDQQDQLAVQTPLPLSFTSGGTYADTSDKISEVVLPVLAVYGTDHLICWWRAKSKAT